MPSTRSLLKQLSSDFPTINFELGDRFKWAPASRTIVYDEDAADSEHFLLHEIGHAVLEHSEYDRDIDLLKLERDAWAYAADTLAEKYSITIDDEIVQHNLDTYRDWLHARSTCPQCQSTGLQVKHKEYSCVACGKSWHVNEARSCALRRYAK